MIHAYPVRCQSFLNCQFDAAISYNFLAGSSYIIGLGLCWRLRDQNWQATG